MRAILKVENLTKIYGNVTAVDHISFELQEGEIVGLLGPNGAGKTTTIHMILSLIAPTEGRIEIFGKDAERHREETLSQMNFAAPYSCLPYNLTAVENLKIFSLLYGIQGNSEAIEQTLRDFNLAQFRNSRSGGLSSGEQMRLALAKAFVNNPKLLLLDEPTSSLDPSIAFAIRNEIFRRMQKTRGAVLWTSHNMREIEAMCHRVIFLSHGRIIDNDTPENLRAKYGKEDLEEIFLEIAEQSERAHHSAIESAVAQSIRL
ncbi:MAG: ABC transporter ATP-binding protein [Candidatus Wildermuthbacteria bacterium]|nr:ABC transporter ATP-binding protein [Candidatus Wildermuthbacteria bacterium]